MHSTPIHSSSTAFPAAETLQLRDISWVIPLLTLVGTLLLAAGITAGTLTALHFSGHFLPLATTSWLPYFCAVASPISALLGAAGWVVGVRIFCKRSEEKGEDRRPPSTPLSDAPPPPTISAKEKPADPPPPTAPPFPHLLAPPPKKTIRPHARNTLINLDQLRTEAGTLLETAMQVRLSAEVTRKFTQQLENWCTKYDSCYQAALSQVPSDRQEAIKSPFTDKLVRLSALQHNTLKTLYDTLFAPQEAVAPLSPQTIHPLFASLSLSAWQGLLPLESLFSPLKKEEATRILLCLYDSIKGTPEEENFSQTISLFILRRCRAYDTSVQVEALPRYVTLLACLTQGSRKVTFPLVYLTLYGTLQRLALPEKDHIHTSLKQKLLSAYRLPPEAINETTPAGKLFAALGTHRLSPSWKDEATDPAYLALLACHQALLAALPPPPVPPPPPPPIPVCNLPPPPTSSHLTTPPRRRAPSPVPLKGQLHTRTS